MARNKTFNNIKGRERAIEQKKEGGSLLRCFFWSFTVGGEILADVAKYFQNFGKISEKKSG